MARLAISRAIPNFFYSPESLSPRLHLPKNRLQNFATSLFPCGLGNESLTVLYAACAVASIIAPAVTAEIGARKTMFFGALCYVVYFGSLIRIVRPVVLAASVVIGIGAALVWIAFGVFITQNSIPATRGRINGAFWSMFQLSNVIGNLLAYSILNRITDATKTFFYIATTSCGLVGAVALLSLRPPPTQQSLIAAAREEDNNADSSLMSVNSDADEQARGLRHASMPPPSAMPPPSDVVAKTAPITSHWAATSEVIQLLSHWQMMLACPLFFFSGIEGSFWSAEFPLMLDPSTIGLVLAALGVGEVIGGPLFGAIGDRVSRTASLCLGSACFAAALTLVSWMRTCYASDASARWPGCSSAAIGYAAAFCFGLADACFNSNIFALSSDLVREIKLDAAAKEGAKHGQSQQQSEQPLLPALSVTADADAQNDDSVGAFTIFNIVQNLGSCLGFYMPLSRPLHDPNPPGVAPPAAACPGTSNVDDHGSYFLVYFQAAFLIASVGTFVLLDRWVARQRAQRR